MINRSGLKDFDATRDLTSITFIFGMFGGMLSAMNLSDSHTLTKMGLSLFSLTFGMLSLLSDFYKLHTSYLRTIELTKKKDVMHLSKP